MQFCMLACKNCNVVASLTKMRMKSERTEFEFLKNCESAKHGAIRIIIKKERRRSPKGQNKDKIFKGGKIMREKMEFVEDFFAEDREITVVEFFLALLVAFLFGMVWGMFLSPKGTRVIGSNNGNNNAGYISDRGDDDEDDEE